MAEQYIKLSDLSNGSCFDGVQKDTKQINIDRDMATTQSTSNFLKSLGNCNSMLRHNHAPAF